MTARMNHLLIFGSVALVAWVLGTLLLVYFWPHLVNNVFKRAILNQGFGDGPIAVNSLYVEPQALFADPLHPPASASKLAVTGVNRDTLLIVGWLDLSGGPQVLHVPDFSNRYYSVQLTDPFNNAFAYVGTRATGTKAGEYLIAAAGWKGQVPDGMKEISAPNTSVLIIGRILVYSDSDLATAHSLAQEIHLSPFRQ